VLEQALLSAETQQALLERAGGNPLYAEQFARLYVERGSADDLPLPETIQGIIAARLDGLPPEEKRLLQDAAVLGKVFWSGGAATLAGFDAATVERALHALARKGLVRRERRSAVSGEDEYAFRHVLVRDVAYGEIPRAERRRKHLQAAGWVESLGRADDHAELVAHHYAAARDLALATGEVEPGVDARARAAFRRAGDRAHRLGAFPAALRFYDDALALWPDDDERPHVLFEHARARFHAEGDPADLLEARDALEAAGAVEAAAEAGVIVAHAAWRSGRGQEAEALLEHARRLLDGRPPSAALAELVAESARIATLAGRLDEAEAASAEAIELADRLGLREVRVKTLGTLGIAAITNGDLRRARALYEEVISQETSTTERTRALANLAVTWGCDGFLAEADSCGVRARELAMRMGDRVQMLWVEAGVISEQLLGSGRWDEAVERATALLETTAALGGHYMDAGTRIVRATILAARGEDRPAREDVEVALAETDLEGDSQNVIPTLAGAAYVYLLLGDHARAVELARLAFPRVAQSAHRAPGIQGHGVVMWIRTGHGDAFRELCESKFAETGRVWAATLMCRGHAADAAEIYAHGMWPHEEAAARLLAAEQLAGRGLRREADEQLERGLVFYRAAGADRIVRDAEHRLAAAS